MSLPLAGQCVDYSKDPAGCQPATFDTPIGQMPSVRVNRLGNLDPNASEQDVRVGVAALEKELHLFRNFQNLHWVLTVPSVKDPATGGWKGGDLDGAGDGRGLGIAGNCIFVGHGNGPGVRHARVLSDPARVTDGLAAAAFYCGLRLCAWFRSNSCVVGSAPSGPRPDRCVTIVLAIVHDLPRRRPLHPYSERRNQQHRKNGDAPHRSEYVPADGEERDLRLRRPVARILLVA